MPTTRTRRRRYLPPEDLRALDRDYVRCRTYGHAWDDFLPMRKPAKFGDRLSLRCIRCATERHDIVSWVDGSLLQREYQHPEDYAMAEHHTRAEFRATLMTMRMEDARRVERQEADPGAVVDLRDKATGTGNGTGNGRGGGHGSGGGKSRPRPRTLASSANR